MVTHNRTLVDSRFNDRSFFSMLVHYVKAKLVLHITMEGWVAVQQCVNGV